MDVGTIQVKIHRMKIQRETFSDWYGDKSEHETKVNEKAKKALATHSVRFV
jgi:hypothetical protein